MKQYLVILAVILMGCNGPPVAEVEEVDKFHRTVDLNLYKTYFVNFEHYDGNVTWDWSSQEKECAWYDGVKFSLVGWYFHADWDYITLHETQACRHNPSVESLNLTQFKQAFPASINATVQYWEFRWEGYTEITYNINFE